MDNIGYRIKIMAHNVDGWNNKCYNLYSFSKTDPVINLISEQGIKDEPQKKNVWVKRVGG